MHNQEEEYTIGCIACGVYFTVSGPRTLSIGVGFEKVSHKDKVAFKNHICTSCRESGKLNYH